MASDHDQAAERTARQTVAARSHEVLRAGLGLVVCLQSRGVASVTCFGGVDKWSKSQKEYVWCGACNTPHSCFVVLLAVRRHLTPCNAIGRLSSAR